MKSFETMDPASQSEGPSHMVVNLPHHIQQELCTTRATYREGKKLTAVKVVGESLQVYTVSNESQHLLIYRVPEIDLQSELHALCERYGSLSSLQKLELVDSREEFTDIFHVCYSKMLNARKAKRFLDGLSFYGSVLHVCYAPELESIEETRLKLINRRNEIAYYTGRRLKVPKLDAKIASKRKAFSSRDPGGFKMLRSAAPEVEMLNSTIPSPLASQGTLPSTSQRFPEVLEPNHLIPGASGSTFFTGAPIYPSQEMLKLPGQEVKVERDRKFTPTSVLRRTPSIKTSNNKIIFHKRNAS